MHPDHVLAAYDSVLVNVAFFASVLFTPVVSAFWPWWREWWGQNIVLLELCISGTLFGSFLYTDFGVDSDALMWVTSVFLTAIPVIIVWRAAMIWHAQRAGQQQAVLAEQVRAGYERYRASSGGVSPFCDGVALPAFEELAPEVRQHWEAVFSA